MELHENLYELGLTSGHDVFDNADLLRAALDDYLDEAAASTGDINLLVDAVRLGAFRMMQTTIDSGAEPSRAVESAGDMLARDRGSADVTAARWACAVLGFAVGKVSATDVRRFDRTGNQQRPPAGPPAPTVWPVQSPTGPPPSSPPPTSRPPMSPPAATQGYAGSYPPPSPSSYPSSYPSGPGGPPPSAKSKTPWILLAVASVVLLAVIGGLLAVVLGGDDDPQTATDGPKTSATPTPSDPTTSASTPTESPQSSSPAPVPTLPPNPLLGSGYAFSLPEAWTDITEEILAGGQSGATDKAIAWGRDFNGARANLIIETGFAGGETDPQVIRSTWESNMVGATGASPIDNGDTTIDGEKAVSVRISRVNENGVPIEQFGYLTIHDGDLYSIILSTQDGDQKAQDTYDDIVESWTWQ